VLLHQLQAASLRLHLLLLLLPPPPLLLLQQTHTCLLPAQASRVGCCRRHC
jgi:hypothetical protein